MSAKDMLSVFYSYNLENPIEKRHPQKGKLLYTIVKEIAAGDVNVQKEH